jgi:hypothetical protein
MDSGERVRFDFIGQEDFLHVFELDECVRPVRRSGASGLFVGCFSSGHGCLVGWDEVVFWGG